MAAFVDTNILLYALSSINEGELEKVAIAKKLIDRHTEQDALILSAQVLSEFASIAIRKGARPLSVPDVIQIIRKLSKQTVVPIDASLVQLALQRSQQSRISYWDALIVEAAIRSGATVLYTEDMHHGTRYGDLLLQNPFLH